MICLFVRYLYACFLSETFVVVLLADSSYVAHQYDSSREGSSMTALHSADLQSDRISSLTSNSDLETTFDNSSSAMKTIEDSFNDHHSEIKVEHAGQNVIGNVDRHFIPSPEAKLQVVKTLVAKRYHCKMLVQFLLSFNQLSNLTERMESLACLLSFSAYFCIFRRNCYVVAIFLLCSYSFF